LLRLGSPSHVPHPALVLLFLLFPFLCEIEVVQRSGNYCHRCGYNLSGSAGGVCPECGVKFGPPASR
jgi:predicted amidophosphoribosyltransferase